MSLDQKNFGKFIENNDLESIALCVENGMDVNKLMPISKPNWQPYFPLFYSIREKKERISLFLIEKGTDVNYINDFGDSAAQYACRNNQLRTLQVLIEKGAPLNQANLKSFGLPIGDAITAGNIEVIKLIAPHLDNHTLEWAVEIAKHHVSSQEIERIIENIVSLRSSNE